MRKDGGHQGKKILSGGQSEAKLQFCGSHLAVEELWESQFTKFLSLMSMENQLQVWALNGDAPAQL